MKKVLCIIAFIFITNTANAVDVIIESPTVRLMPPSANMTAGYFIISNNSNKDIVLVEVNSSKFKTIEMHNTVKENDVMKMVKQNSITIPANSKLEFKPMSYHLMLMMPKKKIIENEEIDVIFKTKKGKKISATFKVKKMNAHKQKHGHSMKNMKNMKHMKHMKYMKRPDYVFPVGIKGGKNMMSKKIMIGYKYGHMDMGCCKDSTSTVGQSFIQGLGYTMAPTEMEMDMHMFSAMYAINSKFTVMAMLPYVKKEMQMQKLSGMNTGKFHKTSSSGIGDLSIAGLYKYSGKSTFKLSLSLPIGDDDEKDLNMMGALKTLPYPMQIGSGTYDVTLGYSYQNIKQDWSYGAQLNFVKRFDYNSEDWRYGDRREASVWAAKPLSNLVSVSFGLDAEHQDNVKGKSSQRNNMTPTWNEYFHSHFRVSANIGLNFILPKSKSRIGIQCGKPVYEDVDGPQMSPDFKCNFGISSMM